jgi:hypothetical protein
MALRTCKVIRGEAPVGMTIGGVMVHTVNDGSPAEVAGLKPGEYVSRKRCRYVTVICAFFITLGYISCRLPRSLPRPCSISFHPFGTSGQKCARLRGREVHAFGCKRAECAE